MSGHGGYFLSKVWLIKCIPLPLPNVKESNLNSLSYIVWSSRVGKLPILKPGQVTKTAARGLLDIQLMPKAVTVKGKSTRDIS